MGKSYKKYPATGWTTAKSNKKSKQFIHRIKRSNLNQKIHQVVFCGDPDEDLDLGALDFEPRRTKMDNPGYMDKDGMQGGKGRYARNRKNWSDEEWDEYDNMLRRK